MISILYGCDDNYAPYTGVSMTSLFENNKDVDEIVVYLAAMDCSCENISRFNSLADHYGRKLFLLDTDKASKAIKEYGCGTWNGSVAAWLRFFVLDQIPNTVDYLVWLDSDTIIYSGIEWILRDVDNSNSIAAVCDCLSYWNRFRLGIGVDKPYFNSGVIVFNLALWRKDNTINKMMDHISIHAKEYLIPDQDMMNVFFYGNTTKLHPRYNSQCFLMAYSVQDFYSVYRWLPDAYYPPYQIAEAKDAPVVLHFFRFLGDYPWHQGDNLHPAKVIYEAWKNKSLWKDHPGAPPKKDFSFRVEKLLYRLLPRKAFL